MNIVIIGAGGIGRFIAQVLSKEQHNVILIDEDLEKLQQASWNIDVAIRQGSGTDWQLLDELLDQNPDLLIALTAVDETNLVAASIAKQLGYPRTIARVRDNRFLNKTRLDFSHLFDVDYFISPEVLVAHDLLNQMISPGSLAVEHFAHGAVQLRTLQIPEKWAKTHISLSRASLPSGVIVGLIKRKDTTGKSKIIFPHGKDQIFPGDEVTFIGETEAVFNLDHHFNLYFKPITSVTIAGGSKTAFNLAKLLEKHSIEIRIIEKDYEKCTQLAKTLPNCSILHNDATDIEFLRGEKIGQSDVIVACTGNDETNICISLLGKEIGCKEVMLTFSNVGYRPLIEQLHINHAVSPRLSTADHILTQVLSGTVSRLVSFYDNAAEVVEVNISADSKVAGISLSELGPLFPKDFLIAMIQNRGRLMVAHGKRIMSPGDTAIIITSPKHTPELKKIF